jgi:hypothetical protein
MSRFALVATALLLACVMVPEAHAKKITLRFPPGSAGCPPPAGTETGADVDGDKKPDWLLYRMTDKNGQDIDVWCTSKGYRVKFSFPGAAPVWIGGCFFNGGRNQSSVQAEYDEQTQEMTFEDVAHDNVDPANGDDLHFRFNPVLKRLSIQKTKNGNNVGEPRVIDAPPTVPELEKQIAQVMGASPDTQTGSRCVLTPDTALAQGEGPSRNLSIALFIAGAIMLVLALLARRRRPG